MSRREKLLRSIYEKKRLSTALYAYSAVFSLAVAALFVAYLVKLAVTRDFLEILRLVIATGVPFVLVGVVRHLIGAKRPYEIYAFYGECPKRRLLGNGETKGGSASFPSRHAYSAFAVSATFVYVLPPLGAIMLFLSTLMCAARVLLGIHFVRDVLAGAIIGATCAVLGELLLKF